LASGTGINNLAIGSFAAQSLTTGNGMTAIGANAAQYTTTAGGVAIGLSALQGNVAGLSNTAVGNAAGSGNGSGTDNAYFGQGTAQFTGTGVATFGTITAGSGYTDGTYSSIGLIPSRGYAGQPVVVNITVTSGAVSEVTLVTAGSGIVAGDVLVLTPQTNPPAGLLAGSGFSIPVATVTTVIGNTAVGRGALQLNQNGSRNTVVGYQAGRSSTGSSNVFIGYQAGNTETQSHRLAINNGSGDLITGQFTGSGDAKVRINGALEVGETYINRSSNQLVIKKNQSASANALQIDFDPTGAGSNTMRVNGTFAINFGAPATPTSGGNAGQFALDGDYIYICVAGGPEGSAQWKRSALSTWS
jgi:hypothetical protein